MSDYICKMCGNYIDTPMHNLGCIVGREENAQQTKPTYEQLEADNARLREAIETHEKATYGKDWIDECDIELYDALKESTVG